MNDTASKIEEKYRAQYDKGFAAGAVSRQKEIDELQAHCKILNDQWLFWYHGATPEQMDKFQEKYGPIIWMA